MNRTVFSVIIGVILFIFLPTRVEAAIFPTGHAHNDYEHTQPLLDALDQGFYSVEADVFLIKETLLVGHYFLSLKPERTLEALYLEPLRQRAEKLNGKIQPDSDHFDLWIDLKTDWKELYPALRKVFEKYDDLITHVEDGRTVKKAVRVILSGNRPSAEVLAQEKKRYVFLDGRAGDLDSEIPCEMTPVISDNWKSLFSWNGTGEMPPEEREKLKTLVRKAHEKGCRIRFWNTPDKEILWKTQFDFGVDYLNTDKPQQMRDFLRQVRKPQAPML